MKPPPGVPWLPFAGPRWCLTPEEMAAVDRAAIHAGLGGLALMETAGWGVVEAIRAAFEPHVAPGSAEPACASEPRAVILIGGGNNGGDGLVVARCLAEAGWRVVLDLFVDPTRFTGDAARQWALVEPMGLAVRRIESAESARDCFTAATNATCIVDALLGTGLMGDVREPIRSAIEALNGAVDRPPVVAVDAPSGLDGATGRVRGVAVRSDFTVTLGFPKPGLFLAEGPRHCGRLIAVPLGYPPAALAAAEGTSSLGWTGLPEGEAALPRRPHNLHKGAAGRLLVLAGSPDYRGAAVLTATAALRSGAGICVVATPAPVAEFLVGQLPEAIVLSLPVTKSGALAARAADAVAREAERADAVALGPGLTTGRGVGKAVRAALAVLRPAIVDADALNVLAADPDPVRRDASTVLTPHPGELGRWLGRPAVEVDAGRVAAAREAAGRWRCHVVLKGSPTVVADPDGRTDLNLTGNPGLATGGSGDVLTGVLGSLVAQGVAAGLAARAATFLHGLAADWAARDLGERGLVPSDLFRYLPLAIREVSAGRGAALLARIEHPHGALLAARGPS